MIFTQFVSAKTLVQQWKENDYLRTDEMCRKSTLWNGSCICKVLAKATYRGAAHPPLSLSLQVLTVLVFWLVTWRNGTKSHYLTAATCPPNLPSFSRRVSPSPPVTYRQRVYYACETGYYYASGASDILVQECQQGGTLSMLNGECKGESIQFDLCIVKSTPSLQ